MWFHVERMSWISETEKGEIIKQGLGLKKNNIFLSDLFEYIIWDEKIPEKVKLEYPNLSQKEFNSAIHIIWCLLTSLQFFSQLNSIENNGDIDKEAAEKLIKGYREKLEKFRENPDDIVGKKGFRG